MLEEVEIYDLRIHQDNRGHLIECWRNDEVSYEAQMMYLSWTLPGKKRGPHLHEHQTDIFTFPGPVLFEIYLLEFEEPSHQLKIKAGTDQPKTIVIPPGVVHGYKNVSMISGLVINAPDQLYKGLLKAYSEDIIRFEDDPNNLYVF
jgi:dTDP-4-dehydrorhamnose 3,5-epimerase